MKKILIATSIIACLALILATKTQKNVLFVGDSLTCYTGGWQDQVSKEFGYTRTNISKGGKRTSWMKTILTEHLNKNKNYDKVFLYGGCNDAYSYVPLTSAVNNIQDMVDLCNKFNIRPIVIIGYDPIKVQQKTPYDEKTTKFHRDRYVELQNLMAKHLVNCSIINKDTTVTRKDSDDGLHLKASGHKKFSKWVIDQMKEQKTN